MSVDHRGDRRRRDRDPAGRARNARPRDASGRPLPYGQPGVPRLPEDLVLTPDETVSQAQRLLDEGLPFQAHEVLEAAWKSADPATRDLWRALAQLAVGLTHAQRGNTRGAVALLDRSADGVARWIGDPPAGLDLDGLIRHATALAERIETSGADVVVEADLRPRLRRS
ncbi:DUF309 domain-containing protein [Pseudonocardia asaccharolytica]|uniref:DUF309 domain-containing protein n=1 Tax=Pseudonocardia asaccharolytica DSM 44247 = NBRC 16224 TaxID=1123024 RepID=A0A511D394_9PSEU|nr:DUF309 domain-containing protein [Pseudonocardia asaccharolytica]GEL18054.1 hypothetical protein PA7_18910 [Pseudonocardia asaccharolytica DSM 44247 = NBRC 16224]